MIADGEEKRSARIYFGISFSLKNHLRNRNPAEVALCFSRCRERLFRGGASLCLGITRNPKTLHPPPHKIIAPGTMVNHYTECNKISYSEATGKLHR